MSILSVANVVSRGRIIALGVAASAVIAVTAFGAGAWTGVRWEQGRRAKLDVVSLNAQTTALGDQIAEMRKAIATASVDLTSAQQSLGAIAQETANDLNRKRRAAESAARDMRAILDARPDLAGVRVGADLMCAWNRANAGPDTSAAAHSCHAATSVGQQPNRAMPAATASDG